MKIEEKHFQEWQASCINQSLIDCNLISCKNQEAFERLLYGLDRSQRRNDGRLIDRWLRRYSHLEDGGWWCSTLDIFTGEESDWGCFKPNKPKSDRESGKAIKYEHPPRVPTEAFFLKIPDEICKKIASINDVEQGKDNFWQWVFSHPHIPVIITEGVKKAAALISAGHVAIALPGINNGYRTDGVSQLIPQLQAFCQRWREIIFCFDADTRYKPRQAVIQAISKTGKLFEDAGCDVSVMTWEPSKGKGIDDFIASQGLDALIELHDNRLTLKKYQEVNSHKAPRLNVQKLTEFLKGEFEGRLVFDDLKSQILLDGKPLELTDDLRFWFYKQYKVIVGKADLFDGLTDLAKENRFNPVQRYLQNCHARNERISIDDLATRYFGTANPLYDTFVKSWLIAAVARVDKPGCQADNALVLYGHQGQKKSSFFETLGGDWHDSTQSDLNNKDGWLKIHSSWLIEFAEFDHITSRKAAAELKGFITNRNDRFRKPYAREISEHPRRSLFCATVNKSSFLLDETGERRYWVIPVSEEIWQIDIEQLRLERDRIWASAMDAYLDNQQWWLEREEELASQENNDLFAVVDEWEFEVLDYLGDKERVSVGEILVKQFGIEPALQDRRNQMRIAAILVRLGWEKEGRRIHQGKQQVCWLPTQKFKRFEKGVQGVQGMQAVSETSSVNGSSACIPIKNSLHTLDQGMQVIASDNKEACIPPETINAPPARYASSKNGSAKGFQEEPCIPCIPAYLFSKDKKNDQRHLQVGDKCQYVGSDRSLQNLCLRKSYLEIIDIKGMTAEVTAKGWRTTNQFLLSDLRYYEA